MSGPVFVLLGEDRAADGPAIQKKLLTLALQCLVEGLQTHELQFVDPPPAIARLAIARRWSSQHDRVEMVRALVTQLRQGRVVVLHYDADGPWPGPTTNDNQFRERIEAPLRRAEPTQAARLVAMVPYTCIESWTYRNTERALELCRARGLDSTQHVVWAEDPALLEATLGIKELSPLRDESNLALVKTSFPRREARADERSFERFVDTLANVPDLVRTLSAPFALEPGERPDAETLSLEISTARRWVDRYEYLVKLGALLSPPGGLRSEQNRLSDRTDDVWIVSRGARSWEADSGSALVRGLLVALRVLLPGRTREEILQHLDIEGLSAERRALLRVLIDRLS